MTDWAEILTPNPGTGNSTHPMFDSVYWTAFGLHVFSVLLAVASVIFGITSWILVAKWRRFQNYVFLSGIVLSVLTSINMHVIDSLDDVVKPEDVFFDRDTLVIIVHIACVLLRIAMSHWLLVATVMFYMETVKVFYNRIKRRYLVVNLFVWVAPVAEGAVLLTVVYSCKLTVCYVESIVIVIICLFLLANTVLYVKVLYTLVTVAIRSSGSRRYICERIILSFAACVISGTSSYLPLTLSALCPPTSVACVLTWNIVCIVGMVNMIGVIVFFLAMRSHREAWGDYLRRRNERIILSRGSF